jgi:hypothetical protein
MQGTTRKAATLEKFNRDNVLPPFITAEQLVLYEKDPYKYIIHLLRTSPEDDFHVLQFLYLKFYPLVIKICGHYRSMLEMDWVELVSFTKNLFMELVFRFDLNSTLYFRTYMPIALSRALYDHYAFEQRRSGLLTASSLDSVEEIKADTLIREHHENHTSGFSNEYLKECKEEIGHFLETCPTLNQVEKQMFTDIYIYGKDITEVASGLQCSTLDVRLGTHTVLSTIKEHLRSNFL